MDIATHAEKTFNDAGFILKIKRGGFLLLKG